MNGPRRGIDELGDRRDLPFAGQKRRHLSADELEVLKVVHVEDLEIGHLCAGVAPRADLLGDLGGGAAGAIGGEVIHAPPDRRRSPGDLGVVGAAADDQG